MGLFKNIVATFLKSEEDQQRLYKVVIPSFVIHFCAAILGLVLAFVMTRGLGSRQYGIFTYSFSIVSIIVNLATYGLCLLAVRETPSLLSKGQTALRKGLYTWSVKLVIILCILFAFLAAGFIAITTFYLHIYRETAYTVPLLLALISVPLFGIMNYYAASLRGQYKVVLSLLPDNVVKPAMYILCVGLLYVFSIRFNARSAVLLNAVAFGSAALFGMAAFYKNNRLQAIHAEYNLELWKSALKSFFLLQVIISVNSKMDILMLGYLKESSQVGIYSIADMVASKLIVFQQIMNLITAASISRMHSLEEKQKLQQMITKVSRYVMLISVPVFLLMVIFSKFIMSYFGLDFENGQTVLIIVATGQIINIAYGPVGNFALMTGNQRYVIIFTAINILLNFSLNLILTPTLGITGTAISTACALIAWNTGMFFTIRKKTGIRTWIFG